LFRHVTARHADECIRCVDLLPAPEATAILGGQIPLCGVWRAVPEVGLYRGESVPIRFWKVAQVLRMV